jgi:hypothetical protein
LSDRKPGKAKKESIMIKTKLSAFRAKPQAPSPPHTLILAEKIRAVKEGSVSVIKQDGRVIQINVCEKFAGTP